MQIHCLKTQMHVFLLSLDIKELEVLKEEAADKKFPNNELLQRLNTVLTDINKCESRSTELLSNSQSSRMSLEELRTLVDAMQNLPCVMKPQEEVQVRRGNMPKICRITH